MINRRSFINAGILMTGVPLLGKAHTNHTELPDDVDTNFYAPSHVMPRAYETFYISHRGVHLKQQVAGENTIEALRLAKRVGFQCVEFDVRYTKDGKPVVIHDATINRTLRDFNGNKLKQSIYVKELTLTQIRTDYEVYTKNRKSKVIVPTFEEYLQACSYYKVIPFVEIKEADISKEQYLYLIDSLDTIIGSQNYVITSNNKVNDNIRAFGYQDITVMGILYQTTFEHIKSWKNAIMAISASRHTAEELERNVRLANQQKILTESHADTIDKYHLILKNGINFISTDALMPEFTGQGQVVAQLDLDDDAMKEIITNEAISNAQIQLNKDNHIDIHLEQYKQFFLYGITLEVVLKGNCKCLFKDKEYDLFAKEKTCFRFPVLLHKEKFSLKINAIEHSAVEELRLTVTKF